jgi:DNA-binding MarR family transcriptional regulator
MQSLHEPSIAHGSFDQAAEEVMEALSAVHRAVRREMRRARPGEISMQQFRTLGILAHHPGASLSLVAQHLGLTTASTSRLVDGLVREGLISRLDAPEDRRRLVLTLTDKGQDVLKATKESALGKLAQKLAQLSDAERSDVLKGIAVLRHLADMLEQDETE